MKKLENRNWFIEYSLPIALLTAIIVISYSLVIDDMRLMTFGLGLFVGTIIGHWNLVCLAVEMGK